MNHDDRYHTTEWDAGQVKKQAASANVQAQNESVPRNEPAPKKKKKKAKRRMNPFLAMVLWVVFVYVSSTILSSVGWKWANDVCALNKVYLEATIEIPEEWVIGTETVTEDNGDVTEYIYDIDKVSATLKEKGLIEYEWLFKLFSKFYNGDRKIMQGTYTLHTEMDYMALIRGMGTKSTTAVTVDVTIPEGSSVQQVISLLAENGVASEADLADAVANHAFEGYDFLDGKELGDISRLEGYLYPDTYNFYVGGKATTAINSMLSNFNRKVYNNDDLTALFNERLEAGYDMDDIITIASLIEKETDGSDRDKIASVIYNRLENAGETYYLLQIDAALVYAAGREITQNDYTNLNSPYNLYQNPGLPPTAISNPGMASIKAALQPAETDYYYYVLGADNTHIFSKTLSEHQRVIDSLS